MTATACPRVTNPVDDSRNRIPTPLLTRTPVTSRNTHWARANRPYASAEVAGAAGSVGRLDRRIIQWQNAKHAAMNSSNAMGNPTAEARVFGAQLSTLPAKSACMGSMSGIAG